MKKQVIINRKWDGTTHAIVAQGDETTAECLVGFAKCWSMTLAYVGDNKWVAIASNDKEVPESETKGIVSDILGGTKWTSTVTETFPDGGTLVLCWKDGETCPEGGML